MMGSPSGSEPTTDDRLGTIVVVDDEPDVREMIEVGLGLDGYRVLLAPSGERALELVRSQPVDLVISDIKMPGMGGIETISAMRRIVPSLRVIVVTGYLAPGTLEACLALGQVTVLRKPFPFRRLQEEVEAALGLADQSG